MAHDHSQHVQTYGKAFAIGIGLNIAYVAVEIIYGIITHSSARAYQYNNTPVFHERPTRGSRH